MVRAKALERAGTRGCSPRALMAAIISRRFAAAARSTSGSPLILRPGRPFNVSGSAVTLTNSKASADSKGSSLATPGSAASASAMTKPAAAVTRFRMGITDLSAQME